MENVDFDDRLAPIRSVIFEECNGEIVAEFTGSESGAEMDRETLENIQELAENDEFDVLALRNLDRLSRADPWDSIDYLLELREQDITLYEHPRRFFAWDDLTDFQLITQGLFFSREWYQRLAEGRIDGVKRELNKERWPFKPHFGYVKDTDAGDEKRNIYLDENKEEVLREIFHTYEKTENARQTFREIDDKFGDDIDENLTYGKVRRVLDSKLCIGKLEYEGQVVNEIPDLAVVDEDLFDRVQAIRQNRSRTKPDMVPEPLVDVTTKFGIEYVQSILEQISFRRCRQCGGRLVPYTKTEVWNIPVEKVQCENCDYDGPLLSAKEFREIHMTAPLRCPFCYRSEEFDVEESKYGWDMYRYKCKNCTHEFHSHKDPDKLKRYLNHPHLGVELDGEVGTSDADHTTENPSSLATESDDTSTRQVKLTEL